MANFDVLRQLLEQKMNRNEEIHGQITIFSDEKDKNFHGAIALIQTTKFSINILLQI